MSKWNWFENVVPECFYWETEKGFTLIEVVIAIALFALIAAAFAASYMNGSILTTNMGHRQEALVLAESGIDQYKTLGYAGMLPLANSAITSYWHSNIGNIKFLRTIEPVCVNPDDFTQSVGCPPITTTPGAIRLKVTVTSDNNPQKFEAVLLQTVICT